MLSDKCSAVVQRQSSRLLVGCMSSVTNAYTLLAKACEFMLGATRSGVADSAARRLAAGVMSRVANAYTLLAKASKFVLGATCSVLSQNGRTGCPRGAC
jgi:hypothetical protein